MADAEGCDASSMTAERVHWLLLELPKRLGLTVVSEPAVQAHADGSVAGVVLIAESHLSLHCFPKLRTVHADIFSCAEFSQELAKAALTESFGATSFAETLLQRRPS